MKEGMTWAAHGDFFGPLEAKDWTSLFGSQANPEALERSNLGIVVAALYAHPLFTLSLRDSIRRQIADAHRFVDAHPDWIIARNAAEARQAIAVGKHIMILGLEGAAGVLERDEDIAEFVDLDGIRIVTLLHLSDDRFGGVAFLKGYRALSTPFAWLSQLLWPEWDGPVRINRNGLSPFGAEFARKLIAHHVWIDLSHASDASAKALVAIDEEKDQPVLFTHTVLRRYFQAERAISDSELKAVADTKGYLGLMPSEEMLVDTELPPEFCNRRCATPCGGGMNSLAVQFVDAAAVVGPDAVAMGSDYNGGIPHLAPTCDTGTDLDQSGLWNIGQSSELWEGLESVGAPVVRPLSRSVDRFLRAWERVTGV